MLTIISSPRRSKMSRSSAASTPSGTRRRATAWNICSAEKAPLVTLVVSSSMLTRRSASTRAMSRMMPGRSWPMRSNWNVVWACGVASGSARCTVRRRWPSSSFPNSAVRASTCASGTLTSRMPANCPANRAISLSSQLPPQPASAFDKLLTSPGRSGPTNVRTSNAMAISFRVQPRASPCRATRRRPTYLAIRAAARATGPWTDQAFCRDGWEAAHQAVAIWRW